MLNLSTYDYIQHSCVSLTKFSRASVGFVLTQPKISNNNGMNNNTLHNLLIIRKIFPSVVNDSRFSDGNLLQTPKHIVSC
jgi:hypothetical protein